MTPYDVIIPADLKPFPAHYEISAAKLLAKYFQTDVEFITRTNHKTADFFIDDSEWELKSPTGSSKYNIQHQLKDAAKQSSNVVLDARRSKIHIARIRKDAQFHFSTIKPIKRLILINKRGEVVELTK
jgi:hypothetical protein